MRKLCLKNTIKRTTITYKIEFVFFFLFLNWIQVVKPQKIDGFVPRQKTEKGKGFLGNGLFFQLLW